VIFVDVHGIPEEWHEGRKHQSGWSLLYRAIRDHGLDHEGYHVHCQLKFNAQGPHLPSHPSVDVQKPAKHADVNKKVQEYIADNVMD